MKKMAESILLILSLVCIGLLPNLQAVSPPPDGGYLGGNTAEGQDALLSLTTGTYNTAIGFLSLKSNKTGVFNTAIGAGALLVNTANENTAIGAGALLSNTSGGPNTAIGESALFFNTTGNANRPPALMRSLTTSMGMLTQLTVIVPSLATLPVTSTRPSELARF